MSTTEITLLAPKLAPQQLTTVLTVAGSDSSGGAGIEADIKAITANGAYALTAITALTAQNTQGVKKITFTDKDTLEAIFDADFSDIRIDVIKTGLLTSDSIEVLSKYVQGSKSKIPLVVDPVLVATSGAQLTKNDVLTLAIEKLIKHSTLLTPNLIEALEILKLKNGEDGFEVKTVEDMKTVAKEIQQFTKASNVLLKGGHIPWITKSESYVTDILYTSKDDSFKVFKSSYVESENTHGTGCTLASSIAANLSKGFSLETSVEVAIEYIKGAILSTSKLGHGNGPLNHVYNIPEISTISFQEDKFVDFLINHPTVNPIWNRYVNHEFVSKVANGSLPRHKFIRFLGQDYPYLIHYSRIHSLALSVAPDLDCINREIEILNEIKHELSLHTEKLKNHGFTDFKSFKMSKACQEYADYLLEVAKDGDWLEINVALSPCLIGYNVASDNAEITTDDKEYKDWVLSYRSDWYRNAVKSGRETIERHSTGISFQKALKLVKIFADVSLLEVKFWDDSLSFEEPSSS